MTEPDFPVPEGVHLWLHTSQGQDGPYWKLASIKVDLDRRRQGLGYQTMRALCEAADAAGVAVALTPVNDFGTSKAFLARWYRSFGFVSNRGRRADLSVSGSMIRRPQPTK